MSRVLALAVIQRAVVDYLEPERSDPSAGDAIQSQARNFLFQDYGDWKKAFVAWCTAAEIEPEWLRDRVRKMESEGIRLDHRRGPKPPCETVGTTDTDILSYLRREGVIPGYDVRRKTALARVLNEAGFTAPRGGPVTYDTVAQLINRNPQEFA